MIKQGDQFLFQRPTDFVATVLTAEIDRDAVRLVCTSGKTFITGPAQSILKLLHRPELDLKP
jgi:hypothetical protein